MSRLNKKINIRKIEYRKNYKTRIIAFVDILGFKNLVEDSTTNKYEFQKILDSLDRFRSLKKEKEDQFYIDDVKVTTFSDSLVISYPAEEGKIDVLYSILLDLTRLQLDLLDNNVIIRGGIAIGQLRHTQSEIFGPAMNEAYYLESKMAKYPRIIICEDTVKNHLKKSLRYDQDKNKLEAILRWDDNDHIYYLDYLGNPDLFSSCGDYNLMLQKIKSIIKHGIHSDSSSTIEKYRWLEYYYKVVLSESNQKKQAGVVEVIKTKVSLTTNTENAYQTMFRRSPIDKSSSDFIPKSEDQGTDGRSPCQSSSKNKTDLPQNDLFNNSAVSFYLKRADSYMHSFQYSKAIEEYTRAIKILEKYVDPGDNQMRSIYGGIAFAYHINGAYAESLEYYNKVLMIDQKNPGIDQLEKATTYNSIGDVYRDKGRYSIALEYYNKALSIRERALGVNHSDTIKTKKNIEFVTKMHYNGRS